MSTVSRTNRHAKRKELLAQRRKLNRAERDSAARGLVRQFNSAIRLRAIRRVGSYVPIRGEISPHYLLHDLKPQHVFIPVIRDVSSGKMDFCQADKQIITNNRLLGSKQIPRNAFGIPEPIVSRVPIRLQELDAILVPLVAFDDQGNRLGMGAGFYDRALAFRLLPNRPKRPLLIGLAYDFQHCNSIESEYWDVPLDAIITPAKTIWPQPS